MGRTFEKTPSGKGRSDVTSKSILKRGVTPHTHSAHKDACKPHCSGGVKSVKFKKSKDVEQMRLRVKLNSWLQAKGKTPSRCRHLMCFDEELSAKKKRDNVLQGRMSGELLAKQENVLKTEEIQTVRKSLFKENKVTCPAPSVKPTPEAKKCDRIPVLKKEKTSLRTSVGFKGRCRSDGEAFTDNTNKPSKSLASSSPSKIQGEDKDLYSQKDVSKSPSASTPGQNCEPQITDRDIQENLNSMLLECITLLRAGCPVDTILPWLDNMELHIPQTVMSASFYACKAEVFAGNPVKMLEVLCQGVRNKAEPSQVLSDAMQKLLTSHLSPQDDPLLPELPWESSPTSGSKPQVVQSIAQDYNNYDSLTADMIATSHDHVVKTDGYPVHLMERMASTKTKTLLKESQAELDREHPKSYDYKFNTKRTPVRDICESSSQLGSTVKYSVSAVTPIPGQSPEMVPMTVVTPVRRSIRLSNRPPTPWAMHQIDSVSDLTLREAETTLYKSNPVIQDS